MYKIIGNDGREYGPAGVEQIRVWITQNRANASTLTQTEGSAEWKPLASFAELAPELKIPPPIMTAYGSNRRIKPWMLAYTVFFAIMSVIGVLDDVYDSHYYAIYCVAGALFFVAIFAGNLLYSLNFTTPRIRTIWKFIFPLVVLYFLVSGLVDQFIGSGGPAPLIKDCIIWLIVFALYLPSFWAHYKIGYGKFTSLTATGEAARRSQA
jgi:hypothetical protein